jgi:phosphohistidine phosphatase
MSTVDPGRLTREVVLLVRHGSAVDDHPLGDGARPLEPEGREAFRRHARRLAQLVTLKGIVTSPLVRAVQTAEILAEACGVTEVRVDGALHLNTSPGRILSLAQAVGTGWALVGHNPAMEAAAQQAAQGTELPLRKGAAVALRLDGPHPYFAWMLSIDRPVRTTPT